MDRAMRANRAARSASARTGTNFAVDYVGEAPTGRFFSILEARADDGECAVVTLRSLTRALWREQLTGRVFEAAMAEVEERTQGQPFRIETSVGPFFVLYAAWRYAGRSGGDCTDPMTYWAPGFKCPARPVWGADWRPVARFEARRMFREAARARRAA